MEPSPFIVPESDEELLAECDVWTFRGTGPGGQGVNTTDSAVRMRHRPTGVTVVCRSERSQLQNRRACIKRLRERLEILARPPAPPRVRTRPSKSAKRRRVEDKRMLATKKRNRRKPGVGDDS
jgi:protein subunit release factor B